MAICRLPIKSTHQRRDHDLVICPPADDNVHACAISDILDRMLDCTRTAFAYNWHSTLHHLQICPCGLFTCSQPETFYHSILFLFHFYYTDCPPLRINCKVTFCVTRMHPPPPCVETCASTLMQSRQKKKGTPPMARRYGRAAGI